jgi:hypothetical protein
VFLVAYSLQCWECTALFLVSLFFAEATYVDEVVGFRWCLFGGCFRR